MPAPHDLDVLQRLDVALLRLRRFWTRPDLRERFVRRLSRPIDQTVFRVLRALERLEGVDASVGDVAAELDVDVSTASRFVDRAVRDGLVRRGRSDVDRRRHVLTLTEAGGQILREANQVRVERMAQLTADWDPDDVAALADLLDRLLDDVQARNEGEAT